VNGKRNRLANRSRYAAITVDGIVRCANRMKIAAVEIAIIEIGNNKTFLRSFLIFLIYQFTAFTSLINIQLLIKWITLRDTMAFELPKLPYDYNALEPYMDAKTMEIHHDKHHAGYTKKQNATLEKNSELFEFDIVEILGDLEKIPGTIRTAVRNNGGGYYHHNIWWEQFTPGTGGEPAGSLGEAINNTFGGFADFKEAFKKAALGVFGSGWAWLVKDSSGILSIIGTQNQDSPATMGLTPLLGIDVWEHSYYLKFQNRRAEYIDNFWNIIDWDVVSKRNA